MKPNCHSLWRQNGTERSALSQSPASRTYSLTSFRSHHRTCRTAWTVQWFESDSNSQMNVICLTSLQLIYLSPSMNVLLFYFIQISPVFCSVAMLWLNMAATLQAFRTEYYLWRSDWIRLLGWMAARNPLFIWLITIPFGTQQELQRPFSLTHSKKSKRSHDSHSRAKLERKKSL